MNKIIKVFKYAGFSLLILGVFSLGNHLFKSIAGFRSNQLSLYVVEVSAKSSITKLSNAEFTNANIGTYQFRPTFVQAILLSNSSMAGDVTNGLFMMLLGFTILVVAKKNPLVIEGLTEDRLWQFVGAGTILFFTLKFSSLYFVKQYVLDLTKYRFEYSELNDAPFGIAILALIVVLTVIYELLSYSRKLKQENDLTI